MARSSDQAMIVTGILCITYDIHEIINTRLPELRELLSRLVQESGNSVSLFAL
jgi:hypothetical protein